jgi:hypothetical protein
MGMCYVWLQGHEVGTFHLTFIQHMLCYKSEPMASAILYIYISNYTFEWELHGMHDDKHIRHANAKMSCHDHVF